MRRGWLTPDTLPSSKKVCTLSFPDNEEFHSLVRGALFLLSDEGNFEQFGNVTVRETADVFRDMLFSFLEDDCMTVPVGACMDWPSNTIPAGWLDTNQGAVSRVTYARLFVALGTTWGSGDGSTTFDLPHKDGRVTVGKKPGDSDFDTLGENGGAKTHALSVGEMPVHKHDYYYQLGGAVNAHALVATGTSQLVSPGTFLGNTGGGGSHNNLQPYVVMNYIIKF